MRATDLFDDFAARYARGERPDVRDYLERARENADELAALIDAYLRAAPAREPAPEAVAMMEALVEGEPPLRRLRGERGLRPEAVVEALIRGLGLDAEKRSKVGRYYRELEAGLLDAERVDPKVLSVLAEALKVRVTDLVAPSPLPFKLPTAYLRPDAKLAGPAGFAPLMAAREEPGPDEVDRLFGVAP